MKIDVVTIFPELIEGPITVSLLGKAITSGLLSVAAHDLRSWGVGPHRSVDDEPYGGGAGMVMRPEPFFDAVDELRRDDSRVVLLSARGHRLTQASVVRLSREAHLILLCGRYEGVDERVALHLADEDLSIGDYVLAGGELAALVVVEAVSRLLPGVIGNAASLEFESHSSGGLEYPHYTRPAEYKEHRVPDVLLSGDHGAVARWRSAESERTTRRQAPDPPDRARQGPTRNEEG